MPHLKQILQKGYRKIVSIDSSGRIDSGIRAMHRHYHERPGIWLIVTFIIVCLLILVRCQSLFNQKKQPAGISVVVGTAKTADVPVLLSALGTVTPTYTITVRTQINGNLQQVYFKEGQMVKAGEPLALIDPRPYEAQLIQYQGQYKRDTALLANAKLDLHRYEILWHQNSISKQIYDTQVSLVQQDQGTLDLDQGLIQSTQLNLIYCHIISPISGQIGLRLVDPGNFVQTSDTNGIAIVNMISPITVVFTLAEDVVPQILAATHLKKTLTVYAYDRLENHLLATGTLLTMDNQIDPTTGTVKLKAIFANNTNTLFPNQFVNIKLLVRTLTRAIIIPTEAIQHNTQGSNYIYVANSNHTVSSKTIVPSITDGMGNTVITSGVSPGESVVIEGADKLTNGATIRIANLQNTTLIQIPKKHTGRSFL